jgi:hypothetical protein
MSVQQLLPGQVLAEASCVGNRATRLMIDRDLNVTPARYFSQRPIAIPKPLIT